jgi:precorrin-6Y C5,15-methyltransferase (decarboxylating)
MTKEEIRMLSVCKLHLADDSTVWDIGAGTGSVAIQCAKLITGMVYALEREGEGLLLIRENAKKLGAHNLIVVAGSAPEGLAELPDPTHVFIGGTGGQLSAILEKIVQRGSGIRVVLNAVLPETAVDAARLMEAFDDFEMIQVQINVGKRTSSGHLMSAHNPVYILSATT